MKKEVTSNAALIRDLKSIIISGRDAAYKAANKAMILTYWKVGQRIGEEEQRGEQRAEYGKKLISEISDELTAEFGRGFSTRNLMYYRKFYQYFPDQEILNAPVQNLTWTHFRSLLRVHDENARIWYMNETAEQGWSSRTLDRNISTQYYYRLMQSPEKDAVIAEMKEKTKRFQNQLSYPIFVDFLKISVFSLRGKNMNT